MISWNFSPYLEPCRTTWFGTTWKNLLETVYEWSLVIFYLRGLWQFGKCGISKMDPWLPDLAYPGRSWHSKKLLALPHDSSQFQTPLVLLAAAPLARTPGQGGEEGINVWQLWCKKSKHVQRQTCSTAKWSCELMSSLMLMIGWLSNSCWILGNECVCMYVCMYVWLNDNIVQNTLRVQFNRWWMLLSTSWINRPWAWDFCPTVQKAHAATAVTDWDNRVATLSVSW